MSDGGEAIGGILAVFVALVLIWALYPVLVQIGGTGYGLLFLALGVLIIIGAVLGLLRGR
jgi:hypothetical protein